MEGGQIAYHDDSHQSQDTHDTHCHGKHRVRNHGSKEPDLLAAGGVVGDEVVVAVVDDSVPGRKEDDEETQSER